MGRHARDLFDRRDALARRRWRRALLWLAIPALLVIARIEVFQTSWVFCSICGRYGHETRLFEYRAWVSISDEVSDWNRWYQQNVGAEHDHRWSSSGHAVLRNVFGISIGVRCGFGAIGEVPPEIAGTFLDQLAPYGLDRPFFELLSHSDPVLRSLAVEASFHRPEDLTDERAVHEWWQIVETWSKDPRDVPDWE
ncbi:MAG: hypothetical protein RL885_21905 [Planctomycetota bacterium]